MPFSSTCLDSRGRSIVCVAVADWLNVSVSHERILRDASGILHSPDRAIDPRSLSDSRLDATVKQGYAGSLAIVRRHID